MLPNSDPEPFLFSTSILQVWTADLAPPEIITADPAETRQPKLPKRLNRFRSSHFHLLPFCIVLCCVGTWSWCSTDVTYCVFNRRVRVYCYSSSLVPLPTPATNLTRARILKNTLENKTQVKPNANWINFSWYEWSVTQTFGVPSGVAWVRSWSYGVLD